jgi:osmotically inducible protein OsmC
VITRSAKAQWLGNLKGGKGTLETGSGGCQGPYSFASRFEEGKGTNPEELIGAAHAGCFSMALSADLEGAGFSARRVYTTAKVNMDKVEGGFKITSIELDTEAEVPDIDEERFLQLAEGTKEGCPVSQALSVEISLKAKLL